MRTGNLEIGICDDSLEDLKRIGSAIYKAAEKLGERDNLSLYLYKDGTSMYKDSQSQSFSLVFLDWEMPGIDGFDLADQLYMKNPDLKVVFVSNYENIVFDAYEYMPLWFVRKHALERDTIKALQKYLDITTKIRLRYRMKDGFGMRYVRLESIVYVECSGHALTVWMKNCTYLQMYGTLKSLEKEWKQYGFVRIHKNYLVNVKSIEEVGVRTVRLFNGTELDMGKNRRKKITELVNQQKERIH